MVGIRKEVLPSERMDPARTLILQTLIRWKLPKYLAKIAISDV
jgi:hypothetical protein